MPSRLGHVHAYQMISSRSTLSVRLRKMKYADDSPIAETAIETMYRIGNTMLVQRLTLHCRTSERKTITLAIAM